MKKTLLLTCFIFAILGFINNNVLYAKQIAISENLTHELVKARFNKICSSWKHDVSITKLAGILENNELKGAGYGGRCYIYASNIGDINDNLFYLYVDDIGNIWEVRISIDINQNTGNEITVPNLLLYESMVLLYTLGLDDKNKLEVEAAQEALQKAAKIGEARVKLNKLNRYIYIQTQRNDSTKNIRIRFTGSI